jgi:hypothetical protein
MRTSDMMSDWLSPNPTHIAKTLWLMNEKNQLELVKY